MKKYVWCWFAISCWFGGLLSHSHVTQAAIQPRNPFFYSTSFSLRAAITPAFTDNENGLLASEKSYTDLYRWSGPNPHGTVGLGMQDHLSAGLPWYNTTLGVAGKGIHIVPVGGKIYDGMMPEPTPGVNVVYGAPGAFNGQGPVRIASATFHGVSHLTHKSYCQGLRLALYGDGSSVTPEDYKANGFLTKDAEATLTDPKQMANTAQIWFWTMPACGKAFIPLGGDGVFGHVNELEIKLVDRELPRVTFTGDVTLQEQRWTNQLTGRINVGIVGSDGGSGVQKLTAKVVGPQLNRTLIEKEIACDYRHLGAPWNKDKPWLGQVCPNEFRVDSGMNNGELSNGISKLEASTIDLSGQKSAQETLELWVDRAQPSVQLKRTDSTDNAWQHDETAIRLQANTQDQLSGVKKLTLFARQGAGDTQQLAEYAVCTTTARKAQCPRQAQPHTFTVDPNSLKDGKTNLFVGAEDLAGNRVKSSSVEVKLDREPPSAPSQLKLEQRKYAQATAAWNTAYDQPLGSGVRGYRYRYQVDSRPANNWQQTASTRVQLNATEKASNIHVWVQTIDNAGNISTSTELEKTIPAAQPAKPPAPAKPPTKPCAARKPCPTKPSCRRNGKPCKKPKPASKPCHKKRCKKPKLRVKPQLAPCLRQKPKRLNIHGKCTLNVWVRGIDVSQGPAGARFNGEQPLPRRATSLTMSYAENAVSRFFDLTPVVVPNGQDEKGRPITKEGFTINGDYWQAPRLIANKPTIVRVYSAFSGVHVPVKSRVTLVGYQKTADGKLTKLGSTTSTPAQAPLPTVPFTDLRATEAGATNFTLPPTWLAASPPGQQLVLQAIARPEVILTECRACKDPANTAYLKDITFFEPLPGRTAEDTPTTALPITAYKLVWNGNSAAPTDEAIKSAFQGMNDLYPLPEGAVQVDISNKIFDLGDIPKNEKGWSCQAVLDKFNEEVKNYTKDSRLPDWEREKDTADIQLRPERPWPHYVGMMNKVTDCDGLAPVRGRSSISIVNQFPLAHEVGHNYNRRHASDAHKESLGVDKPRGTYTTEPWPDDYLFGSEHGSINGFYYGHFTAVKTSLPQQILADEKSSLTASGYGTEQAHTHDFMSYGGSPEATSPNTWNTLLDGLARFPKCKLGQCPYPFPPPEEKNNQPQSQPANRPKIAKTSRRKTLRNTPATDSTPGTTIINDPTIKRDRVVDIESTLTRDGKPVPSPTISRLRELPLSEQSESIPNSPYRFVAYDTNGSEVSDLRVRPPLISETGEMVGGNMFLPASATRIRLLYDNEIIAERNASPNPPTAKLLAPTNGEHWYNNGTTSTKTQAAIRWEINDPDNDQLTAYANYIFNNQYSGTGIPDRDPDGNTVDPKIFEPTTNARILLTVSDGWHTIELLGPPFSVEPHPFPPEKIFMLDPKKQTFPIDRKSAKTLGTPFTGGANDPNTFSSIDDDRSKREYPYRWYLNGRLLSKEQRFVTTKLACSPSPARVTITVKGSYNQVGKKTIAIPLTPKKPPRTCNKKKRRRKR